MQTIHTLWALPFICLGTLSSSAAFAQPTLSGLWTDGAVVQKEAPLTLSGTAVADASLNVSFGTHTVSTVASTDGQWSVELPPHEAGGPFELTVSSANGSVSALDIHVGDVLLCSGQSNMEYPVYRALNPDSVLSSASDAALRLFTVPKAYTVSPQKDFSGDPEWQAANADSVRDFSAICYFTGRMMRQQNPDVTVGLVDVSWGGSQIEAWLSEDDLAQADDFDGELQELRQYRTDTQMASQAFGARWEDWWLNENGGTAVWQESGENDWKSVPSPMQDWKNYGDPDIENHIGRLWFRHNFELTEAEAAQDATFHLGLFDDADFTWLNGSFLGSTFSWSDQRTYTVNAEDLKSGVNNLTINVMNSWGQGGMMGPDEAVYIEFADGSRKSLASGWTYMRKAPDGVGGPSPAWTSVSGFTTIYNAMLHPLKDTQFTAGLWYQGESNAGRAETYELLLDLMTDRWREMFTDEMDIVIIQLPGFGSQPDAPVNSGWGRLREAQRQLALSEPNTGLAITMDAGDRRDIHPSSKLAVAQRVYDVLQSLQGLSDTAQDGIAPTLVSSSRRQLVLELPEGEYKTIGSDRVIAMEVCDASDSCQWADTSFSDRRMTVSIPRGMQASSVRHCWGDAPICNLFTADDTPVVPFEITVD